MSTKNQISNYHGQLMGALWGAVVGDALGVPVEFTDRAERQHDPVISMRGGGTWRQPPGTWSDDSSLLLCSAESLLAGFNTEDMGRRFVDWHNAERWTPWGSVFDIGMTTRAALLAISRGMKAEHAGGTTESSNGNGSLMRILPVALHAADLPIREMLERIHRASAITHGHPRSQMACGLYGLLVRELIHGNPPLAAWSLAKKEFASSYLLPVWAAELSAFNQIIGTEFVGLAESAIESDGYVMHTLMASVWCLLNSGNFSETVLRAVNLGGDTDTTACVTGGLAGLYYQKDAIPVEWISMLARKGDLDCLFHEFFEIIAAAQNDSAK